MTALAGDPATSLAGDAAASPAANAIWMALRAETCRGASRLRKPGAYIAVPSAGRPLIVASGDRGVLRYLADAVITVPPGTGSLLSALATAGVKLLRYRVTWFLAAALRAADVVVTREAGERG